MTSKASRQGKPRARTRFLWPSGAGAARASPPRAGPQSSSRRRWPAVSAALVIVGSIAGLVVIQGFRAEPATHAIMLTVYASPDCTCCQRWVEHLRANQFDVTVETVSTRERRSSLRERLGIPENLAGCHTAVVDGYFVEGHVPAQTIERMLADRPRFKGITVPGMPSGSPGMEGYGPAQHFDVMALTDQGAAIPYQRW